MMICYKNINEGYLLSPQEPLSPLSSEHSLTWPLTRHHSEHTEPRDGLVELNML